MNRDQIAISYNRRWLWGTFWWGLLITLVNAGVVFCELFIVQSLQNTASHIPYGLALLPVNFLVLLPGIAVEVGLLCYVKFVGSCLWKKIPACIINREGIVDNSSNYLSLSIIPWAELDRIYIADIPSGARWIMRKHKAIIIRFKALNPTKPWLSWWAKFCLCIRPERNWTLIFESQLTIPASEFMDQLNDYYWAHVMDRV